MRRLLSDPWRLLWDGDGEIARTTHRHPAPGFETGTGQGAVIAIKGSDGDRTGRHGAIGGWAAKFAIARVVNIHRARHVVGGPGRVRTALLHADGPVTGLCSQSRTGEHCPDHSQCREKRQYALRPAALSVVARKHVFFRPARPHPSSSLSVLRAEFAHPSSNCNPTKRHRPDRDSGRSTDGPWLWTRNLTLCDALPALAWPLSRAQRPHGCVPRTTNLMIIDHAHHRNERTNDYRSDEVELVHPEIPPDGLTHPALHPA